VLYWIGAWTLIVPTHDRHTTVAFVCITSGAAGLLASLVIEELRKADRVADRVVPA
jgi:hypothetical protein